MSNDAVRTYRIGAWVLGATHLLLWTVVAAFGWLYWDDFILQGQAARLGLSADLLLNNHDGHLVPGAYLLAWVTERVAPLQYWPVFLTLAVMQVLIVLLAAKAFAVVQGVKAATLAGLGVFLLTPILVPGATWWAAAIMLQPMIIASLVAVWAQVVYLRTGNRKALAGTFIAVAVSLCFFEKSVLLPVLIVLVTVLEAREDGIWAAVRSVLRARWRLWAAWTGLLAVYFVLFSLRVEGRDALPTGPGQVVTLVLTAVFRTIAPAIVGGPLQWAAVDFSASMANPPAWLTALGTVVLAALVVTGCRRPGKARKAWVAAGVYLAADLASFAAGRLGPYGDPEIVLAGRYVADAFLLICLAIGFTAAEMRLPASRAVRTWGAVVAGSAVALMTIASTTAYGAIWAKNPAQIWVGQARDSLAAADPSVPLLDQDVPDFILLPVTNPYNQMSWFLAPLRDRPALGATSTGRLQFLDNRGFLVPATVDGAAFVPPTRECQNRAAPGEPVTIGLIHPIIAWAHTVQVRYDSDADGVISVAIGSGVPVEAPVTAGSGVVNIRAEGGEQSVTITSSGPAVCIRGGAVGRVAPEEVAYRGFQPQFQRSSP